MARRTVAQLQRELEYAKNKEAYKPPTREQGAITRRSPRIAVAYKPMQIAAGEAAKRYKVQASQEAVLFFGQTALKTPDAGAEDPLPRGAQPAKVTAMVSDGSPELVKAKGNRSGG